MATPLAPDLAAPASTIPDQPTTPLPRKPFFPPHVYTFPRVNWIGVVFAWPIFYDGEDGLKVQYAARSCSRRWLAALNRSDLGSLGVGDFALAVFDKTDEM